MNKKSKRFVDVGGLHFEVLRYDDGHPCARKWEVGVLDEHGAITLSALEAPEGLFDTLREARAAIARKYGLKELNT